MNWKSFSPTSWKIGTLKGLFRRAHIICSEKSGLDKEISHLKYVFSKINDYPSKVVNNTLQQVVKTLEREKHLETLTPIVRELATSHETPKKVEVFPYMSLPYKGLDGENIINNLKNHVSKILPKEVKPRFTYKGKKLGSFFVLKDPIKKEHMSDLVYGYFDNSNPNVTRYVGETNVRYGTRTHEHCSTDKKSSIYKDATSKNYDISQDNFRVLEAGFNKTIDRKIAESLYIKELNPELNEQVRNFNLKLFN